MALSNILEPNFYDIFVNSITSRLPIPGNTGPTGPQGIPGPLAPGITGATGATGATGSNGVASIGTPAIATDNNVLTLTGSILNAEYATTGRPGVLSSGAQTISGSKTFADPLIASQNVTTNSVLLPTTTSSIVGTIQQNSNVVYNTFGTNNLFEGSAAGNFTTTGQSNVGMGPNTLQSLTSGSFNCCLGNSSGKVLTTGTLNTHLGNAAGFAQTSGSANVLIGANAAAALTTASNCIAIGTNTLASNVSGNNIIEISDGTIGSSNPGDIRIGYSTSTACYIRGINGVSPGGTLQMVVMNPFTQQLGSQSVDNNTTQTFIPTLDSGTITASTNRGSSSTTMTISTSRVGVLVAATLSAFVVQSQSGSALTLNYTGVAGALPVACRPTYPISFPVTIINGATFANAVLYITSGGFVTLQLLSGAAFTTPFGNSYDIGISWSITPP